MLVPSINKRSYAVFPGYSVQEGGRLGVYSGEAKGQPKMVSRLSSSP